MTTLNVIKTIQQKDSLGSYNSPVFFGAEQRFVGALRQSNNNNLEEQSILGLDCITTEYVRKEDYVRIIKKEYRNPDITTNYYVLDIEVYDGVENSNAYFDDATETLVITGSGEAAADSPTFVDVRKETLSYVNENGGIDIISTKLIQKKTENGVTTMQEVITNNL